MNAISLEMELSVVNLLSSIIKNMSSNDLSAAKLSLLISKLKNSLEVEKRLDFAFKSQQASLFGRGM